MKTMTGKKLASLLRSSGVKVRDYYETTNWADAGVKLENGACVQIAPYMKLPLRLSKWADEDTLRDKGEFATVEELIVTVKSL